MDGQGKMEPVASLRRLGFSDLEAGVYLDLLRNPGSTGYRIGKSINKPHANVYQALTALEQKGAVLFEEGESRTYHAVPPEEMFSHLRKGYEEACNTAQKAVQALRPKASEEDRFLRLTTADQVYARARAMLAGVEETLLIEAGAMTAEQLRGDIEQAVARGVAVAGLVFRAEDAVEGARLVVTKMADRLVRLWPGDQLTLIADGREFLLALFDRESGAVKRAIWVSSPYVATILNNGIVADVILHGLPFVEGLESQNMHVFGRRPPALEELLELGGAAGDSH
jgi:sugar-specific transcriptional regulator TrmB